MGGHIYTALLPPQFCNHALPSWGGPSESYEDRGAQRVSDYGGHLHALGSGDNAGNSRRPGRCVQEGGYRGQEGSLAETAGQHVAFPSDRDLRLISGASAPGRFSFLKYLNMTVRRYPTRLLMGKG